jgi:uncharacterized protein (TIRG00374 family)
MAKSLADNKLLLALGIVVGVACLWFAFRNVEAAELWTSIRHARWQTIPVFLAVLFLYYWLKAERWSRLLAPIKPLRTADVFPALMVGYGVSSILPLHLGEFARVLIVRADHSIRVSALLMSIAVERLLDLVTIPVLFAVAMLAGRDVPDLLVRAAYVVGLGGLAGILFMAFFVAKPDLVVRYVELATAFFPKRWTEAVTAQLRTAATGAAALKEPRRMISIVAITLAQWAMMWLCVWLSIWSVGISVSWSASMLTVALINVAVALPTSPGYVGSVQAAFVLALLAYGVANEAAVAASIYFHVLAYVSVVLAGLFFMRKAGQSLHSLIQAPDPAS